MMGVDVGYNFSYLLNHARIEEKNDMTKRNDGEGAWRDSVGVEVVDSWTITSSPKAGVAEHLVVGTMNF